MADLRTKIVIDAENRARNALRGAVTDVDRLRDSVTTLKNTLATVALTSISVAGLRQLVDVADGYKLIAARVKLASQSTEEFQRAQAALFDISQRTMAPLSETAVLYTRLADSIRALGGSQTDALDVTEAINQSLRLSGASAATSAAGIQQFGQAIASGVLRGDEFNSVMENSPRLARALADGLGKPITELRALAEAGELTANKVVAALLSQKDKLASEYRELPTVVGAAFTQLGNEFTRFVDQLDASTGTTAGLASGIQTVARNFDALATSVLAAGGVIVSTLAGRAAGAIATYAAQTAQSVAADLASRQAKLASADATRAHAAMLVADTQAAVANASGMARLSAVTTTLIPARNALAAAEANLARAQQASSLTVTVLSRGLSLIGGPIGLITTLLGAGATAWALWGNKASEATSKAAAKLENVRRILADIAQEKTFGAGDLGSLREREQELEQKIAVQVQTRSAGAAARLAALRDELERVQSGITTLEQRGANIPAKAAGDASGRKAALDFMQDFQSKTQKLSAALAELEKHKPFLSAGEFKAAQAEIQRRFAEAAPKVGAAKQPKDQFDFVGSVFSDATRDLEAFAARQQAALDALLGDTTIAKTQRLQEAVSRLQQEFNAGRIGPEQYGEAIAQLTGRFEKASDEMATLQQLIAETDFGKTRALLSRVGVADDALFSGLIDDKTHQQIIGNLTEIKQKSEDTFSSLGEAVRGAGRQGAQAMTDMVFGIKGQFNILESFARDVMNRLFLSLTEPLTNLAVKGITQIISQMNFGSGHSGAIIGQSGGVRTVSPLAFLGAPRLHSGGLLPGEVPFIGMAGEEVLTADDPRHRANGGGGVQLTVNMIEAPGRGGEVNTQRQGNQITLDVLVEMIESKIGQNIGRGQSPVFSALQAVSGLSRVPGTVR